MRTVKLAGWALLVLGALAPIQETAEGSQVAGQWYFGSWNCRIDGRPSKMRWRVAENPQTTCAGGVCSTVAGVKVVGHFSDNGGPWVPLKAVSSGASTLSIRYMGAEQDNWFLRYNPNTRGAAGWTTWRGRKFPLTCADRR